ncbi:hypothetical protein Aglo03_12260 [Actinokineospora globicatena]|uniref:Peptidase C51 domain-containing protein n=1 Tax=Actinokineospora globicatena TaxID=103729 RepID=A0A9W6V5J2_9PSEU|nr:hypothetical protein Aglo03_12260 [Actinokineospora globicatena]
MTAGAASTKLCTGYAGCSAAGYGDGGYGAASGTSYWGMVSGHNCTNYAAYRLIRGGVDASYLRGNGMAYQWRDQARRWGVAVNGTPARGAIAWWAANSGGSGQAGHVAYVEQVGDGSILVSEDNYGGDFHWRRLTLGSYYPTAFLHFEGDPAPQPPSPTPAPAAPGEIKVLDHGSRVTLGWGAVPGAQDYLVYRNGVTWATTAQPTYLDTRVSPGQAYHYAVRARNSSGVSGAALVRARTATESADRAHLSTAAGPALCGRSGNADWQSLVCSVWTSAGWVSSHSPRGDWAYPDDRTWLTGVDGSASYCGLVGSGDQIRCDRFDGTAWTTAISPRLDVGYPENRAFLSTSTGLALCGRSGNADWQSLICTTLTPSGWVSTNSPRGDWGYADDRTWVTGRDGTVSYCGLVGTGDQVRCDRFDGVAWSTAISAPVDVAYPENRTFLPTASGPALCGRSGNADWQSLTCTTLTPSGWVSTHSPAGDWAYPEDRAWLTDHDGSVSYCGLVGSGDQIRCDRFDGAAWSTAISAPVDVAYPENRAFLSTSTGPALCGRSGNADWQSLICTTLTPSGWVSTNSPRGDWGYDTDRSWSRTPDSSISYCRRVGAGDQITCDRLVGSTWTTSTSDLVDVGYPDTF